MNELVIKTVCDDESAHVLFNSSGIATWVAETRDIGSDA
jgi:hypothetical protein